MQAISTHEGYKYIIVPIYITFTTRTKMSAEIRTGTSTQQDSGANHNPIPNGDSSTGDPTPSVASAVASPSAPAPEEENVREVTPPPVRTEPSTALLLQYLDLHNNSCTARCRLTYDCPRINSTLIGAHRYGLLPHLCSTPGAVFSSAHCRQK